jgi:hypothetical protein
MLAMLSRADLRHLHLVACALSARTMQRSLSSGEAPATSSNSELAKSLTR